MSPLHRPRVAALGLLAAAALASTLGLPSVSGMSTASAAPSGASTASTASPREPQVAGVAADHRVLESGLGQVGDRHVAPQPEVAAAAIGATTVTGPRSARCTSPGSTGSRVQAIYVYYGYGANRVSTLRPYVVDALLRANNIVYYSARQTGGYRELRLVTGSDCRPWVAVAHLPASAASSFSSTVAALQARGYTSVWRKYIVFADARYLCGLGQTYSDDQPGRKNRNNRGPQFARVDLGCWSGSAVAHEVFHTLGAVQKSAPHSDGALHCRDERDLMCYSGAAGSSVYTSASCTTSVLDERLDCNKNDFFHTNPAAGSYLATRWNTARSAFLWGGGSNYYP